MEDTNLFALAPLEVTVGEDYSIDPVKGTKWKRVNTVLLCDDINPTEITLIMTNADEVETTVIISTAMAGPEISTISPRAEDWEKDAGGSEAVMASMLNRELPRLMKDYGIFVS